MKKIYSACKIIRILIIVLGIPLILIELIKPGLFNLSNLCGGANIFGINLDFILQVIVVGSELGERFLKLKQARFHLFSPLMVPILKRLRF